MIEVVGDPGPATRAIAVYVPGTGTNLDMSHVNTDVADDLVNASGGRLVAVAYLDGEFPQDIMADAGLPASPRRWRRAWSGSAASSTA
ncbi:hypothetical protein ACFSSF_14015 [Dietzia aerolata]|uniref:hypothetical protein n=1 Tax=Dietzia aerolata TaxID=595984 RepID=UPI00362CDE64